MLIKNAHVFTETAQFVKRDIVIGGQYIIDGTPDGETIDGTDLYAIPGLIDTHIHGAYGIDFTSCSVEEFQELSRKLAKSGITSFCPTTVSTTPERISELCKMLAEWEEDDDQAIMAGMHLEGPYLSREKKGAHGEQFLTKPNPDQVKQWIQESDEKIAIVTLAPEIDGADVFIKQLSPEISCSIGHTSANYTQGYEGFACGANRLTHLFNRMPTFSHKDPGVIGAAFDHEDVMVEIVCDGVHVHPSAVRGAFSMFGEDRMVIVSDSTSGCGMGDGEYTLGTEKILIQDGISLLPEGQTPAGTTKNLYQAMKYAVQEIGFTLECAVRAATMNPAVSLGIFDKCGSVTPGKYADIILIDEEMNIRQIILRGDALLPLE